jgi:predicted amidophosphoribosyltransferase
MEIDAFLVVVVCVGVVLVAAFWAGRKTARTGASLVCASCGAECPSHAKHCPRCGKALT